MRKLTFGALMTLCLTTLAVSQDSRSDQAEIARKAEEAFDDQKWEEAAAQYGALVKLDEKNAVAWHHLGYSLHALGKLDEALAAHLKTAEFPRTRAIGLYNAGCVHGLKKDKDKAFDALNKAAAAGFNQVDTLAQDADLAVLRDDPRWEALVTAVKNAESKEPRMQAFAQPGERKTSRVVWFSTGGSPGQAAVSYGATGWKDDYAELAKSKKFEDKRWRLGKDFWTTFDSNIACTMGATEVPAGYYYLTLERKSAGDYVVAFNDASAVRKLRLDAFQAAQTKGGIEVVMKHEAMTDSAGKLAIQLSVDADDQTKGAFTIRFGPNKLSVPVTYKLADK